MIRKTTMARTGILRVASFNAEPKRRTRKCAICRNPFEPRSMTHKVCCGDCGIIHAIRQREAADRKATKQRLVALKSRADHLKDAQAAFNAFIRERDAALPCVSCGRFHTGAYDAGHYRSVGAMPALRFNETNCHKQCVPCNQHKAGNIVEYRIGLIKRIGLAAVEWLEQDHAPAKYTIDDAKAIKAHYKAKTKALKSAQCLAES